jgi:hypothetical protein
MFNQIDRGVGVGFLGPMMDSHGIHHRQAREVFLEEMAKASGEPQQVTLAQLSHRFQNALVAAIPEYDWYADCWACLGSIALPYLGGPVSTSVGGGGSRVPRATTLVVRGNPGSGPFPLVANLQRAGDVTLDVYDVAGRRVTSVVAGDFGAGEHIWTWKPDERLASGVYFVVLNTQREKRAAKLILVR